MYAHAPFVKSLGCLEEKLKSLAGRRTRMRRASQQRAMEGQKTTNSAARNEEKMPT